MNNNDILYFTMAINKDGQFVEGTAQVDGAIQKFDNYLDHVDNFDKIINEHNININNTLGIKRR
jgi:hypothetical protein